ncbi:hypothetical protein G6O67_006593 [Ophiocordyceps sinensis]|uniref:Uncharacterized protein n=1 Tax=Ophiocordyceps sinensis TaxID=72228 RepID=A0A8H4PN43_9HYPO|nr:hypothetical protein G6O67_006593 [Ophiocordyceps sinensis]
MVRLERQMDARGTADADAHHQDWIDAPAHVQGLSDTSKSEETWAQVRRFNRQTFRVRAIDKRPLTGLDMNVAAGQDVISPQRLGSHLERLYMSFLVDYFALWKQIVRLRSWREKPRTLSFLAVYTLAWLVDLVTPILVAFLIILIIHPPARRTCFPPLPPPALIGSKTGGLMKLLAGELASDSGAGAPEMQLGEAVEQEARNFATNIGQFGAKSGNTQDDHSEDDLGSLLTPARVFEGILHAKEEIEIQQQSADRHETKEPVSRALESLEIFPAIRMLPEFIDTWERLRNALKPDPPFPLHQPRMILASCLLPILIILCLATWDTIMKVLGFLIGLGFFGGPLISPCLGVVDTMSPGWRRFLELRHTVLRGAPTNAQLTIALLRTGERDGNPLRPPPDKNHPSSSPNRCDGQDLDHLSTSEDEVRMENSDPDDGQNGARHIDQAKALAGNNHAKDRLGALEAPAKATSAGPLQFSARYRGDKGHVYITKTGPKPAVSWRRDKNGSSAAWTVALADITELRKVGGLGWKCKFMVEAVLGWQVLDGLVVKTREGGEFHLTAIGARDEIFNRLISMGSQMWEMF